MIHTEVQTGGGRAVNRVHGPALTGCPRLLHQVSAGVRRVPYVNAIISAGPDEVALLIAEPVQNAGGCLVPHRDIGEVFGSWRTA